MTPMKRPMTVTEYVAQYDPNGMELGGSVFWRYVKIPSQAPTPENLSMEWLYSRSGNKLVSPYMERMAELKATDLESAWLSMGTMLSLKYLNKWQDITDALYAEYSAIVDEEITKTLEQSVDTDRTTGGTDTDEITRTLDKSENLTEAVDRSLAINHKDVEDSTDNRTVNLTDTTTEDTTDKLTVDRSKARTGNDTDTTSKEITETDTKTHLTDTDQTGTDASQQNLYSFNNVSGSAKGATAQNGMTTGGSTTTGTDTDERSYTENVTVSKGLDETETDTGTETTDRDRTETATHTGTEATDRDRTVTSTGTDTEDVDRTQTVTGKDTESTGRTTSRTGSDKLSMDKSARETTSGRHRPAQELIEAEIKLRMSHILTEIILSDVDEMTTLSIY